MMMLVPILSVVSVSEPVGMMEATGLVIDGGGVKGISIVLLGATEVVDGASVVTGIVAFPAVVGMT
jgi:hypothetical protein